MANPIRCPICGNRIIQKTDNGRLRIRTKIISFNNNGKAEIVCRKCGNDIEIDLQMGSDLKKIIKSPRLILKNKKSS